MVAPNLYFLETKPRKDKLNFQMKPLRQTGILA